MKGIIRPIEVVAMTVIIRAVIVGSVSGNIESDASNSPYRVEIKVHRNRSVELVSNASKSERGFLTRNPSSAPTMKGARRGVSTKSFIKSIVLAFPIILHT